MHNILIYQDYRHNNGALYAALAAHYGTQNIDYIDAARLLATENWMDATVFVLPGGAGRYFEEKLGQAGREKIRAYVHKGGCFFGICAGAYYACRSIAWRRGEPGEILAPKALGLFGGEAIGPIPELHEKEDPQTIPLAITPITVGSQTMNALYWGGPLFKTKNWNGISVLATFSHVNNEPAVIAGRYGFGRYVLSSIHPEYNESQLAAVTYNDQPHFELTGTLSASLAPLWRRIKSILDEGLDEISHPVSTHA